MKRGIPSIPSTVRGAGERSFLKAVKDSLEQLTGARGNNQALTVEDLEKLGLLRRRGNTLALGAAGGGTVNTTIGGGGGGSGVYDPFTDETDPSAPTGVSAAGGVGSNFITWTAPSESFVEIAEVWKQGPFETAQTGLTREDAYLAGTAPVRGSVFADPSEPSSYSYYWVRFRSLFGNVGPWNAVAGIEVQTTIDPAYLLATLSNQINSSQLGTELSDRIVLTESGLSLLDSTVGDITSDIVDLQANDADFALTKNEVLAARSGATDLAARIQTVELDAGNAVSALEQDILQIVRPKDNLIDCSDFIAKGSVAPAGFTFHVPSRCFMMNTTREGKSVPALRSTSNGLNGGDGGFYTPTPSCNPTKTYRFSVLVRVPNVYSGMGRLYLGCSGSHVQNMSGTVNTNPYFINYIPTAPGWYLLVGYIYPYNATEAPLVGGLYNADTMDLVAGGTPYRWHGAVARNTHLRTFQYYATNAQSTYYFTQPRIEEYTGDSPGLDLLAAGFADINTGAIAVERAINAAGLQYSVKLDANGYVSGFGLSNDGSQSQALFRVDRFGIGSPGSTELAFAVDGGKVVMDGAFIKNATITDAQVGSLNVNKLTGNTANFVQANIGTLTTSSISGLDANFISANINNASVGTLKIAGNAVTVTQTSGITSYAFSSYGRADNARWRTPLSFNFSHGHSGTVYVRITASGKLRGTDTNTDSYRNYFYYPDARILVNGTVIRAFQGGYEVVKAYNTLFPIPETYLFDVVIPLNSSTHTIAFQVAVGTLPTHVKPFACYNAILTAQAVKR